MPHARKDMDIWGWLTGTRPGQDFLAVHDLVCLTLQQAPGRPWTRHGRQGSILDRWRNGDQARTAAVVGSQQGHIGPEGKARKAQRLPGVALLEPGRGGQGVLALPDTVCKRAGAVPHASKIAAQHRMTQLHQGTRRHDHHLVVHGATHQGMGMQHQRHAARFGSIGWLLQDAL